MAENTTVVPIKGNDIFFTLDGKRVYHATNHQLSLDNDYEEYETKNTDGKVQVLSGNTGTAQCDSMCCVIGSTTQDMDTAAIVDAWKSGEELALSLKIGTVTYNAPAWIQSLQITASVGQRATCNASFKLGTLTKATA